MSESDAIPARAGTRVGRPQYGGVFASDPQGLLTAPVLPGELVTFSGDGQVNLLEASPDRVRPGCVHFGTCGGCQYQHAAYPAQLAIKQEILNDLLRKSGIQPLPDVVVAQAEPWGYRNRIRLRIQQTPDGPSAGYRMRGSNEFLPVSMCPIAAPLLWRAVAATLRLARKTAGLDRWFAQVGEVELFCTGEEARLQMTFLLDDPAAARNDPAAFNELCESLKREIPELAGAAAMIDPEEKRRVRRSWAGQSWGAPGLVYEVAGRGYWVSRASFFQVNRLLVDRLVTLVTAGERGSLAWDLFAGAGLFSRALAEQFTRVVAVEGGASGAADLAQNAEMRGRARAYEPVHAATLDFLRAQEHQRERPELVVLDPPRAGLGTEGAALLARIAPGRIAYVSCDPETLARDLAVLLRAGYRLASVTLVDLFPQTFHLETVVHLQRGENRLERG